MIFGSASLASVDHLADRESPAHRHQDQPGAHAGELQLEDADVVLGDHRHPVARLEPEVVAQQPGEPPDAALELAPALGHAALDARSAPARPAGARA